jgi:enhancing lycopene biosynthesis protein 2
MKSVAVILSGCGVFDGSEIHEAVLTLLALDRASARVICAATDAPQHHVTNHLTKSPAAGETRNMLLESARIARGNITPLSALKPEDYQAIILPGGFGAANNLSNFGTRGGPANVHPEVAQVLRAAHSAGKPLGFICIAPGIAASLFGAEKVELTIGNDAETARQIEASGARHVNCPVHNVVIDRRLKIVSTPAYMLANRITEVEAGISKLVQAVLEMA